MTLDKLNRPNILFITSDQHRADSLGCYGHPCVQTPHLDQLAYEGMRFTNAYSNCPVCIPARTSLITGIKAHRYGKPSYAEDYRIVRSRKDFLGSLITDAGYQSCLVGKTHWHTEPTFRAGFEQVVWMSKLRKQELIEQGRAFNPTGIGFNEITPTLSKTPSHLHSTDWIVDQCIEFLETRECQQPFFLWASFTDPHPPFVIHEPYYSMYDSDDIPEPAISEWSRDESRCPYSHYMNQWLTKANTLSSRQIRKARAVYYGMITNIDHQLGRLFGKIMHDGDWENTLVVYLSDHGEFLGDHGTARKSSFLEAAANVPLIIRPPLNMAFEPGGLSDALVDLTDVLPTFCDFAGANIPEDIDGKSLMPLLKADCDGIHKQMHGNIDGTHMIHSGRYKYIYWSEDGKEMLFDTVCDPCDMHPIYGDKLKQMRQKLIDHLKEERHEHLVNGELLNQGLGKPPITQARAQDGAALGPTATLANISQISIKVH